MKVQKIISLALIWIPSLLLLLSAGAKFAAAEPVVEGLTKVFFIPYFPLTGLAILEVICVVIFLIPQTWRIGFFLLCGYLGGALAIEIAQHGPPVAAFLLTFIWVGAYFKDKSLFVGGNNPAL